MRSLKFRAWDKVEKRYRRIVRLNYDDGELVSITVYDPGDFAPTILPLERVILEQCTGLKDRNGKEIYEGDILQIDDHILGDFVVVWHNFGWKIKRSVGYESLSVHKSEDCTVIGNIHESNMKGLCPQCAAEDILGGEE